MHTSCGEDEVERWKKVLQLLNICQLLFLRFKFGFGCKRETKDYIRIRTDTGFPVTLENTSFS